jgi:hypothetical protein
VIPVTVVVDRVIDGRARHFEYDLELPTVPRVGEAIYGLAEVAVVRVYGVFHHVHDKTIKVMAK